MWQKKGVLPATTNNYKHLVSLILFFFFFCKIKPLHDVSFPLHEPSAKHCLSVAPPRIKPSSQENCNTFGK